MLYLIDSLMNIYFMFFIIQLNRKDRVQFIQSLCVADVSSLVENSGTLSGIMLYTYGMGIIPAVLYYYYYSY